MNNSTLAIGLIVIALATPLLILNALGNYQEVRQLQTHKSLSAPTGSTHSNQPLERQITVKHKQSINSY